MSNFVGKDQDDGDKTNPVLVLFVNILNIYTKLLNLFCKKIQGSMLIIFRIRHQWMTPYQKKREANF